MDAIWGSVRGKIDSLEAEHAALNEWKKSALSCHAISSIARLREETRDLGLAETEREELSKAFSKSSSVFHFGYDFNYQALVFFDAASKAWMVIKW